MINRQRNVVNNPLSRINIKSAAKGEKESVSHLVRDLEVAPDVRHDDELVAEFVCGQEFSQVHRADVRVRRDRSDRGDRLVDWTVEDAIKLSSESAREIAANGEEEMNV